MTDYSRFKNESLIKIYTNALSNVFNNNRKYGFMSCNSS